MERKKRSKGSLWEFCYANTIFGTFGDEIKACGQKLVKFCAHTHAAQLVVEIEKYYLVNNMHEACLFMQVRYNTAIPPVHVIPTLQTCKIVYYILLNILKFVALCLRLDQLIAYYCVRRNMAKFTSRFPRLRIPFNPTVG